MAQEKEEILIEIVVSNEAATKTIFENQQSIERLKNTQLELTKARKAGTITEEEYSKKSTAVKVAIDSQKESIRQNEKELRNNIKTQKDGSDSLAALRAQLSNNVKAFDNLSKAERESAKGKELQDSINSLMTDLTEAEQATGRFRRQVGKYPESMGSASKGVQQITGFLGKMSDQVGIVSPKLGGFISSLNSSIGGFASKADSVSESVGTMNETLSQTGEAANKIEGFAGKASGGLSGLTNTSKAAGTGISSAFGAITSGARAMAMVFLTPPVIIITAIVLAIVAAFMLLKKGFELNDEASTTMAESFAVLKPIMDVIGKLASFLAGAIADIVHFMAEAAAGTIDFVAGLFGIETGMKEAAKEAMNLVRAADDLDEAERQFSVTSAKRAVERARLLAEVTDKEKNTAEQRIAFLKDASELDKKDLEDKKKLADENLRIIETLAKNESDTSDATADKIAAAKIRSLNAEKEYFEGQKEINKKLIAAEQELEVERKAAYDKWKQRNDDRLAKETQALRQLEDLVIGQIKDDYQRQIETEKAKTERANSDLRKRLKNEENLTDAAKKAIDEIILLNEKNLIDKEAELIEKSLEENIKKEIDAKTKSFDAQIQLSEKNSIDELNIKQAKLLLLKDAELSNDELTNVERLAIVDRYEQQEIDLRDKYLTDKQNRLRDVLNKEFDLKILNAQNTGLLADQQAVLELQKTQAQYDALINMDAETKAAMYANQIDYEIAVAQSQKNLITSQNQVLDAQIQSMENFNSSMRSISNSIGSLISQMGEDSYEAAKFARGIAVVNIGLALAEGIAGVVKASAKSVTIYDMLASLAAGAAAVGSAIFSAKKAFAATPEPKKPKFATGGLITGSGTGTSDSIDARVSNGESIINAQSTSMFTPLLSALNQAGGGVSFGSQDISNSVQGEAMLARAFAKGVAMLPNPIVSVKEIIQVQNRVTVLENL